MGEDLKLLMEKYRIVSNGYRYKIQKFRKVWIFNKWSDLGSYLPPYFESFFVKYYSSVEEAQEALNKIILNNKETNTNWEIVKEVEYN